MSAMPQPAAVSRDPWTGDVFASVPYADGSGVEATLAAAASAQVAWRRASVADRTAFFERLAHAILANEAGLAGLAVREMGKPVTQALGEVRKCAALCQHYAAAGPGYLAPEIVATEFRDSRVELAPLGVILSITPWNFPFWQILRFAIPTLLVGNAVVVKPAPNTVQCALALEALAAQVADGAAPLQVLVADVDQIAGAISDRRVAGVGLTGSARAGRAVASLAGQALKPSLLELGGSDAFIVLDDSDVEAAAAAAADARFANSGQVCIAAKRILVARPLAARFEEAFVAATAALRVGDPGLSDTFVGPMARADLRDGLEDLRQRLVHDGAATLLDGGPSGVAGFLYAPTILAAPEPLALAAEEEAFGPLAVVHPFDRDEDAIAIANASPYGLTAMIWGADLDRAGVMARQLDVGGVYINTKSSTDPRLPVGGVKESGYGRELGPWGVRAFANVKTLVTR